MKTQVIKIDPQFPDMDDINYCAKIIRHGGLVVFPTETVYGIAANFNDAKAMNRLREVKKRSGNKPFAVLISQKGLIANYTPVNNPKVYKLIDEYWPGPLTVVVPTHNRDETIGIRMPQNIIALKLVEESQCTVAAPSANFENNPPPTTCEEALRDLNGLVNVAIDGGPTRIGTASSVVDFTKENPVLLRDGVITQADVKRVTEKKVILFVCTGNSCRSVMAEYLLRDQLKDREDVQILSAGTGVFVCSSASSETLAVLRRRGIDASEHQSCPINNILLKKADLILVMTRNHRHQVLERTPEVENRVYLLREFAQSSVEFERDLDIPDPIGKPPSAYEECASIIQDAVVKLVKLV